MKLIVGSIDLNKITESRLYHGKNNSRYLSVVLMELDEPDRFGNHFRVVEGVSKEERAAGTKGPIIGSAKHMGGQTATRPPANKPASTPAPRTATQPAVRPVPAETPVAREPDDDIPF